MGLGDDGGGFYNLSRFEYGPIFLFQTGIPSLEFLKFI